MAVLRPRKGGLRRGKFFLALRYSVSAQCLRLSERFFHNFIESVKRLVHASMTSRIDYCNSVLSSKSLGIIVCTICCVGHRLAQSLSCRSCESCGRNCRAVLKVTFVDSHSNGIPIGKLGITNSHSQCRPLHGRESQISCHDYRMLLLLDVWSRTPASTVVGCDSYWMCPSECSTSLL